MDSSRLTFGFYWFFVLSLYSSALIISLKLAAESRGLIGLIFSPFGKTLDGIVFFQQKAYSAYLSFSDVYC